MKKIPTDATRAWKICHIVMGALQPLTCSLRIEGEAHVPRTGGVVIACNHPGGMDSFVLALASPRQVYYMAKRELFNIHPLVTLFLNQIGAFPINRGARDIAAVNYSVQLLREGRVLGMFPEGTRNRGKPLRRGKSGAVRVALEADVPVVPAVVLGIPQLHQYWYNPLKRTDLSVQFGEPLRFPAGTPERVPEYTTEVMLAIARMLPPELRGLYAENVSASTSQDSDLPRNTRQFNTAPSTDRAEDNPAT